ncbi:polysaccharide pyruvyl transferase family protein [Algoriphagus aestuariicola]|uniref:Polysaccharide pyruvyl transferase family protein n=1 Tax=Algoriphagus aestuariicola TaxID=1852016 RepID=A0ABS3BQX6_9BACT|nr:polysaccharide pyruvyl transferase family protein [Algoriphagus aestuariicola]MBN7800084.1 polysaccharide pyruvyl transferase family protein [Algoriphagus aestuariicola]
MKNLSRRELIKNAGLVVLAGIINPFSGFSQKVKSAKTILLVSGWQDVNIGDIAHTPGLLNVFQTYLPEAKIILWKRSKGTEVGELLKKNFPKVEILYGSVDQDKNVDNPEILDALQQADLMVHGSGPLLVGADNLAFWMKNTDKPFGVFGTTLQSPSEYHQSILKKASFIYTRETLSIEHLKKVGIEGDHIQFAPDATFFMDIKNDSLAGNFMSEKGLEEKKFICVIPRLRYTPYHQFNANNNGWTDEKIKEVETVNAAKKEEDHAKLRAAMIAYVKETGNKILVCPEMTYQVDIMDELLIDPLPEEIKPHVVKRGYWFPDEAASVYEKALAVLSFECHSPIIAAVNGTPFFYLRQPEDTIKGNMYYDLGFNDWIFEIEETTGNQITDSLRNIWTEYPTAQGYLKKGMDQVSDIYKKRVESVDELV